MKADYVHKDSKTINDEIVSYKITMPLTNNEELQRIDNNYNELVDEFTKQYTKEKDMIVAQRIMMNLRKENKKLHIENQKLKEVIDKAIDEIETGYFIDGNEEYSYLETWFGVETLLNILKEVE